MNTRRTLLPFIAALTGILSMTSGQSQEASFTANPIADAFVATGMDGGLSGDNFGAAGALAIAAPGLPEGEFQTVLKFDLSGAGSSFNATFGAGQWTIQSMALQLNSSAHGNSIFNNIAAGQFNVSLMRNNSWTEGTGTGGIPATDGISFNSLESTYINNATDQAAGTFDFDGGNSGANNYSLDLTSGIADDVAGGDELSLRLYAADNVVSYLFSSRMAGSSLTPALIINVDAVPEPRSMAMCAAGLVVLMLGYYARRVWQ